MNDSPNRKKLNRVSRVESKTETIEIKYLCNACRCDSPEELTEVLLALQDDFGGNRIPQIYGGSGSVEISIPVIQLVVTFVLSPYIKKYLDGLLNGDSFKDLGEEHRHKIMMWLSKTEKELSDLFLTIKTLTRKYPHAINRNQKETSLVTLIKLGDNKNIRFKLNDCSASAIETLPDSILKAIIHAVKTEELGDVRNLEMRFDSASNKWLLTSSSGTISIDFDEDYFNT